MTLSRRVVVVEDHESLRRSLTMLLSHSGFAVRSAHNGLAALELMKTSQPDILLSDLNMPGMDGYELLKIVHSRYPEIYAVTMSGEYTGDRVPEGVVADAFYAKNGGPCTHLLTILDASRQKPRDACAQ